MSTQIETEISLPEEEQEKWFLLSPEEVEDKMQTSMSDGLTSTEVTTRLETYGYNELTASEKRPRWKVFLDQFKDVLIYILIASAVISAVVEYIHSSESGHPSFGYDWIVIAVIVLVEGGGNYVVFKPFQFLVGNFNFEA